MSLFLEDFEVEELRRKLITVLRTGTYSIASLANSIGFHYHTLKKFIKGENVTLQNLIKIQNWLEEIEEQK